MKFESILDAIGNTPMLVRLSVGLEDADDLIEDIEQAIERSR